MPSAEFVVLVMGRDDTAATRTSIIFQRQSSTNFRASNLTITVSSHSQEKTITIIHIVIKDSFLFRLIQTDCWYPGSHSLCLSLLWPMEQGETSPSEAPMTDSLTQPLHPVYSWKVEALQTEQWFSQPLWTPRLVQTSPWPLRPRLPRVQTPTMWCYTSLFLKWYELIWSSVKLCGIVRKEILDLPNFLGNYWYYKVSKLVTDTLFFIGERFCSSSM